MSAAEEEGPNKQFCVVMVALWGKRVFGPFKSRSQAATRVRSLRRRAETKIPRSQLSGFSFSTHEMWG